MGRGVYKYLCKAPRLPAKFARNFEHCGHCYAIINVIGEIPVVMLRKRPSYASGVFKLV